MRISDHISYKEGCGSPTARRLGINNDPNPRQLKAMQLLATKVFEPLRNHFNTPIKVESFYRSLELNRTIGGSFNSQHMVTKNKGAAIDIDDDFGNLTNADMFYYIVDNLTFDQILWEYGNKNNPGWVHVSYNSTGNRKKISIVYKKDGYSKYKHFYKLSEFILFKENLYNN